MKKLVIKDWLFQKIARENSAPKLWDDQIIAVFAETEKAYKVMIGTLSYTVTTWIPKSQAEWTEAEHEGVETKVCENYEEAKDHLAFLKSCYC